MPGRRARTVILLVIRPRVKMPPCKIGVERCESGRIDMLGKHASQQWDRGFESHPLRHSWRDRSCRMVDRRAVARQPYQMAIKFSAHEKVSPGDKNYLEQ